MKKWTFTAVCLFIVVAGPAMGAVNSLHLPNVTSGNTFYTIALSGALSGASPTDIDTITVTGPGGDIGYSRADFTYSEIPNQWRGFYLIVPELPLVGDYSFVIKSGETIVTTHDTQGPVNLIPIADTSTLTLQGNTFSWGRVSLPGTALYYRIQIRDGSGRTVFMSAYSEKTTLSIPDGILTSGQTYRWRVRVTDSSDWVATQNESFSEFVPFTWAGLSNLYIQHRVFGDGRTQNHMQFQLLDGSNQNLTPSVSLSEIKIYDPNGQPVSLSELVLNDVTVSTYNTDTGQWNYAALPLGTLGYPQLSDPLIVGAYTIEVTHNDKTYTGSAYYNGPVSLPFVDPSTFVLTSAPNGDLTWSWSLPESPCSAFSAFTGPRIDVYQQGQRVATFFFRAQNSQCISSLLLPAAFVQAINAMGDEIRLFIDIRTNDFNNSSLSSPLTLTQLAPPAMTQIEGEVSDALTTEPIAGATITLEPGTITLTTQTDGTFPSTEIPALKKYSAEIAAPNYYSKTLEIEVVRGVVNQLNTSLDPYLPTVVSTSASENEVGNDGQGRTLLTARITHPLGPSSIDTVVANLQPIGGSAEQIFYDDGSHGDQNAGDGIYSYQATVANGTSAKPYALVVTAIDVAGKEGSNHISLKVKDKVSGTVPPSDSVSQNFDNTLGGQTLNIHFDFTRASLSLKTLESDCQVELTILGPNGEQYGPYSVTDSIDVSIPNAAAGQWEYVTNNPCTSALSYEIETSGGGTGVLVGRVMDGLSGAGVTGATINCNTGGSTVSLAQGYYSTVAVAGTGQVITSKAGYQTNVRQGIHVKAGGTTSLNIQVVPENASAQAVPSGVHIFNVLDPADDPKPPTQPFAIKLSGSALEFNVLFPRYQQAVDLYLAFMVNSGSHSGKLFFIDQNNSIVEFAGTLHPWKTASSQDESGQIPIPNDYPLGAYTLYSLVMTDSSTLANFDLSYFTTIPPQPPPAGQDVTFIPNPTEEPNPLTQPLAAKIVDGNLVLNVHFPEQKAPVTIVVAYLTPSGDLYLVKNDNTTEKFSGNLSRWREDVTGEVAAQVLSIPTNQMSPGVYYFCSLVTTDPDSLSNFDLVFFSMNVTP